jgi:hypothetical protein
MLILLFFFLLLLPSYNSVAAEDSLQVLAKKRVGINTRSLDDSIVLYEVRLHRLADSASQLYEMRKQKIAENQDVSKIEKQLVGIKKGNSIYRAKLDSFINVSQRLFTAQPEIILNTKKPKPKQ